MAHSFEAQDNNLKSTSADPCTSQSNDITALEYQKISETVSYSIKQDPKDEASFQLVNDNNFNNYYTEMSQSYYYLNYQFNQLYEPLFEYNQDISENNAPMNSLENINTNYDQTQAPQSNDVIHYLMENQFGPGFVSGQNELMYGDIDNTFTHSDLSFNQEQKSQLNGFTQPQLGNLNYSIFNNDITFMNIDPFMNLPNNTNISYSQTQNPQPSDFNQNQQSDMIWLEFGDNLSNLTDDSPMNPIEASNLVHNKTQEPGQNDSTKYISDILNLPVTGEYLNNLSNNHSMDPFGESLLINNQTQDLQSNETIQHKFDMLEQPIFSDCVNSFSDAPNLTSLKADNRKYGQKCRTQKNNSAKAMKSFTEKHFKTPAIAANFSQKRQLDTIDEGEEDSQAFKTQKLNSSGLKNPKKLNLNNETLNTNPKLPSNKECIVKTPLTKTRKHSVKICTKKNTILTFEFNSTIESKRRIRAKEHIIPISIIKAHKPFEYVTEGILSKTENEIDEETEANTELNGCVWNEDY